MSYDSDYESVYMVEFKSIYKEVYTNDGEDEEEE